MLAGVGHDRRHLGGGPGEHHDARQEAVRAGVRGVPDQVGEAGEDLLGAEEGEQVAAEGLGGAARAGVGHPVG
ncbi:hypothetical protein WP39_01575 [Streptomyces sp. 604F]|nr:hypothetical protein [Streptomyces sp. 604F]